MCLFSGMWYRLKVTCFCQRSCVQWCYIPYYEFPLVCKEGKIIPIIFWSGIHQFFFQTCPLCWPGLRIFVWWNSIWWKFNLGIWWNSVRPKFNQRFKINFAKPWYRRQLFTSASVRNYISGEGDWGEFGVEFVALLNDFICVYNGTVYMCCSQFTVTFKHKCKVY